MSSSPRPDPAGGQTALPPDGPRVRLVLDDGHGGRNAWELTSPVTVVGWGDVCSLRLSDKTMSKMQCLVVHTGRHVLLRDLHSPKPTLLNDEPVSFSLLSDGDVIKIGKSTVRINVEAVQSGGSEGSDDPLRMPGTILLKDTQSAEQAPLTKSVSLLGRRKSVDIHLEDAEVSPVHAVVFPFEDRPMVLDLASRKGLRLNGADQTCCQLQEGDCLRLGAYEMTVHLGGWPEVGAPSRGEEVSLSAPAREIAGHAEPAEDTDRPTQSDVAGGAGGSDSRPPPCERESFKELDHVSGLVSTFLEEFQACRNQLASWECDLQAFMDELARVPQGGPGVAEYPAITPEELPAGTRCENEGAPDEPSAACAADNRGASRPKVGTGGDSGVSEEHSDRRVNLADLDPEVRDRLRILRRINSQADEADLLEQAIAELEKTAADPMPRRWPFRRRK